MADPCAESGQPRAYEALIQQYLDGRPIAPATSRSTAAERDRAFFCHPLWEDAPQAAFEHELFAVAYARYVRQEAVANPGLLRRALALAPQAVMRAIRYAQLCLNLDSPRWRELLQLKGVGVAGLDDFLKLQEIINRQYRILRRDIQAAETAVRALSAFGFLLYAGVYGFQALLPERARIERRFREATEGQVAPELLEQAWADSAAFDRTAALTGGAIRQILTWKLRTRPEGELQLDEQAIAKALAKHLTPLLSLVPVLTEPQAARLKAVARLIQAHIELQDFLDRAVDSYSFNDDFNLILAPDRRSTLIDPAIPRSSAWENDGRKLQHLETYWFTRAARQYGESGLADGVIGTPENHDQNQLAVIKALQSRMYLAEVYGLPDEVALASGATVDLFLALRASHLTTAFFRAEYIRPFAEHYAATGHWRIAMRMLVFDGLRIGHNRMPLTWATRSEKAQALVGWTVGDRYPQGDPGATEAILTFWTLDLRDWAARLRADERAELPELYEQPYLQFGAYLVQIPWLGASRHTANAAINQLRLSRKNRPELRDETRAIEEQLGRALEARGFRVVLSYQPPRRAGADDPGEVDVIGQRDGHLFVIEVKSTYVRSNFREAWQHKYQTLRRAGRQVARKRAAVTAALQRDGDLARRLGLRAGETPVATHGWIVDTSIEHDHARFSGQLKLSLEELLIVLRNERHLLLGRAEATQATDLYPDGFDAGRFAAIIEGDTLWSDL